jgi:hypothetical protein
MKKLPKQSLIKQMTTRLGKKSVVMNRQFLDLLATEEEDGESN